MCSLHLTHPSAHTHTWRSGQPTLWHPGSSRGFSALLKGLTSVVDNSSWSRDSNPQPWVTSLTLYPLGHDWQHKAHDIKSWEYSGIVASATSLSAAHPRLEFMWQARCPRLTQARSSPQAPPMSSPPAAAHFSTQGSGSPITARIAIPCYQETWILSLVVPTGTILKNLVLSMETGLGRQRLWLWPFPAACFSCRGDGRIL